MALDIAFKLALIALLLSLTVEVRQAGLTLDRAITTSNDLDMRLRAAAVIRGAEGTGPTVNGAVQAGSPAAEISQDLQNINMSITALKGGGCGGSSLSPCYVHVIPN